MAKLVHLADDIDGSTGPDVATREFVGPDGARYEIDLSDANHAAMIDAITAAFAPYVANGTAKGLKRSRNESKAVREWARANGFPDLSERGAMPKEVQEAYDAAHATAAQDNAPVGLPKMSRTRRSA